MPSSEKLDPFLYSTEGLALTKANYYIREDYQARMEIDNQEMGVYKQMSHMG